MLEIISINPATEKVQNRYPLMQQPEVEQIIQTMDKAQHSWMQESLDKRTYCLSQVASILRVNKKHYATIITEEMGKPISQALAEIEKCAVLCDFYAKHAERFLASEPIAIENAKAYRYFQPLGVIFAIMPWNFPFWQVLRFAVPNLVGGNAGLLKHAPNSTGAALAIEDLFLKAGFPAGLFRSLVIDVSLSPFIIQHPKIMGVTLTGSNRAGQSVAATAGHALKKVVLELGGSDPYLILEDADLELAATQCVQSRLSNAGQICISAKRIIVIEKIKKAFEVLVLEKAKKYITGNPLEESTILGPMAREDLRKQIHDQVQRCIATGARCLLGGLIPEGKGYYYPATVLTDINPNSPAFTEELFGPVICIIAAKDDNEAISLANNSTYGLAAAVFTQDLKKGEKIAAEKLQAGTCTVNTLVASDPRLPFGGIKQSGYGRELSVEGMREFMNIKTVLVRE
jgi:succinate-semialdehyde dehydrogenase/glutarate-semialdehyde dehydrogenase